MRKLVKVQLLKLEKTLVIHILLIKDRCLEEKEFPPPPKSIGSDRQPNIKGANI